MTAFRLVDQEGDGSRPATQAVPGGDGIFQSRVLPWLMECFGAEIAADRVERCDRFIEESLELAQSLDWPKERAIALVDYVYGRPAGEPYQEVGGVMVTLAALCQAVDLDMQANGETELARIMRPEIVTKIRAKQAAKPTGSALPVAAEQPGTSAASKPNSPAEADMVVVPREPTQKMLRRGIEHITGGSTFDTDDRLYIAKEVYRAMIAAATNREGEKP